MPHADHSNLQKLTTIAAFAGPAAGAAGRSRSQDTSPPASQIGSLPEVLDKRPRGGPRGSGTAFEDPAAASRSPIASAPTSQGLSQSEQFFGAAFQCGL
jgi:hypothetical protein